MSSSVEGPIERGRTEFERERWTSRRAEVIDTAARLFAAKGYHATSLEDLTKATGLQRGGLYHYMSSKMDLLIQIHERFIHPLLRDAQEIVAIDQPAVDAFRQLARALMRDIAQYQDQVTVFLQEWRAVEDDAAWAGIRQARRQFEDVVETVLERGEQEGSFVFANRRLAVLGFIGMLGYTYQWYSDTGSATHEEIADEFAAIFIDGAAPR